MARECLLSRGGEGPCPDCWEECDRFPLPNDEGPLWTDEAIAALGLEEEELPPEDAAKPASPLEGLNPQQEAASRHVDGPARVTAGAGSGKTRTLVARVIRLIEDHQVEPEHILLITFSRKAAGEMKERLHHALGWRAEGVVAGTFHAIALKVLREAPERFGRRGIPTIWDDETSEREMRRLREEIVGPLHGQDAVSRPWTPSAVLAVLGAHKDSAAPYPSPALDGVLMARFGPEAVQMVESYESSKESSNAWGYEDLVWTLVRGAMADPELATALAERWRYVIADEYQDTNQVQEWMLRVLCRKHRNLMVIGDDDQSLYGWRGSDVALIREFPQRWSPAEVYHLGENYRSTPEIVAAADRVISKSVNREAKKIWTSHPSGEPLYELLQSNQEAQAVEISRQISRRVADGARPSQCAVLVRTRNQLRKLHDVFKRMNHQVSASVIQPWWRSPDGKLVMGWVYLLVNPLDLQTASGVLSRCKGVGAKTVAQWREIAVTTEGNLLVNPLRVLIPKIDARRRAALEDVLVRYARYEQILRTGLLRDLLLQIHKDAGVADLIESLKMSEDRATAHEGSTRAQIRNRMVQSTLEVEAEGFEALVELIDTLATSSSERKRDKLNEVVLTTVHSSKGLEWDHVWIAGFYNGRFPFRPPQGNQSGAAIVLNAPQKETVFAVETDLEEAALQAEYAQACEMSAAERMEEERRIAYVAITRARKSLTLCRPRYDYHPGESEEKSTIKSPYWLDAIPPLAPPPKSAGVVIIPKRKP